MHPVSEVNYFDFDTTQKYYLMRGFFQYEQFFENVKDEIINHDLKVYPHAISKFKSYFTEAVKAVKNSPKSVAFHMRLGDYVRYKIDFPIDYYINAIEMMKENVQDATFFVFTDSIQLAEKKLAFIANFDYVIVSDESLTSLEEFELMRLCKHFIIPNSTFSWWAAYLSLASKKDKQVIAPFPRLRKAKWRELEQNLETPFLFELHQIFRYPKEWLLLTPFPDEPQENNIVLDQQPQFN
eukprot:403361512